MLENFLQNSSKEAIATFLFAPCLFTFMLLCLGDCFFGYVLLRIHLALKAACGGMVGAVALLAYLRPGATGIEQFVACTLGAAALSLAAWFLHRLVFAASVLACTVVLHIGMCLIWERPLVVGIVFGLLIGAGLGVLAYLFTRGIWIILSACLGGLGAALCAACIVMGPQALPLPMTIGAVSAGMASVAIVATALAVAGAYVQFRYTWRIRIALAPPPEPQGAKPKTSSKSPKRSAARPAVA